jgi:uncharacterized protein YndB with AHSA1/START domain
METLHFSIKIKAPKERVWSTMLADETFRQWAGEISKGSYYEGSWEQGGKIKFMNSNGSGVLSRIAKNKPHECISIENYGVIENGVEKTQSPEAAMATSMQETYTFRETDGVTEVLVTTNADGEYKPIFEQAWPKALLKLKALCER